MGKQEPRSRILSGVNDSLKNRFEEVYKQHYNRNTKGYNYEEILSEFFQTYMGGLFEFHTRTAIIDKDLKAFEILEEEENEFDVIATYNNACPRIVLKSGKTNFVPFDAVAFFVEVGQTLEKGKLDKDLQKLNKLNEFDCSKRFGMTFTGDFSVNRPLKTLFYYERKIDIGVMVEMLMRNATSWDLMLVLSDDVLVGNAMLPVVKANLPGDKPIMFLKPNSLLNYMLMTQSSMTFAPITNTGYVFLTLLKGK